MPTQYDLASRQSMGIYPVSAITALPAMAAAQTIAIPESANFVMIEVDAQALRFRLDGVNPTASVGWKLATTTGMVHNVVWVPIHDGSVDLRVIETAASCTGFYQFFKVTQPGFMSAWN